MFSSISEWRWQSATATLGALPLPPPLLLVPLCFYSSRNLQRKTKKIPQNLHSSSLPSLTSPSSSSSSSSTPAQLHEQCIADWHKFRLVSLSDSTLDLHLRVFLTHFVVGIAPVVQILPTSSRSKGSSYSSAYSLSLGKCLTSLRRSFTWLLYGMQRLSYEVIRFSSSLIHFFASVFLKYFPLFSVFFFYNFFFLYIFNFNLLQYGVVFICSF